MPLIDSVENKKSFKKKNQRPWDLLGDGNPADGGADTSKESKPRSLTLVSDGTTPLLEAAHVEVARIHPDPKQVRQKIDLESTEMAELADSIRRYGVRQPITVWSDGQGAFEIVFGERRFHAAKKAGLTTLPCLVLAKKPEPDEKTALQLVENLHRLGMSPLDEAAAYELLATQHGLTHEQIAERVGRSRFHITKTLRLLDLSADIREQCATSHIGERPLSFEHLLEIARQDTHEKQAALLEKIRSQDMSVKDLRAELKGGEEPPGKPAGTKSSFKSHKFIDPEDRFWMMIHFKQAKIANEDILAALEKAVTDVKRAISRAKASR